MKEINIPFAGFYESIHSQGIDEAINQSFDAEGNGMPEVPDDFYMKMEYGKIHDAYVNRYAAWVQDKVNEFLELPDAEKIVMPFKDMSSPKYYNYSTDRLFCEISEADIHRLYDMTDLLILERVIKEKYTSCDGFSSFYSNSLTEKVDYKTTWDKPLEDWDHNQLGTLLIAAILSKLATQKGYCSESKYFEENYEFDAFPFYEDIASSGALDNMIWNNAPEECVKMMNDNYEKHHAKTA